MDFQPSQSLYAFVTDSKWYRALGGGEGEENSSRGMTGFAAQRFVERPIFKDFRSIFIPIS